MREQRAHLVDVPIRPVSSLLPRTTSLRCLRHAESVQDFSDDERSLSVPQNPPREPTRGTTDVAPRIVRITTDVHRPIGVTTGR